MPVAEPLELYAKPLVLILAIGALATATPSGVAEARDETTPPTISDQDVVEALDDELTLQQAVPRSDLTVTCVDGVVTLSGSVDHVLGKERAVRVAKSLKGVRSVVDRIDVAPPARTDEAVRSAIVRALARDPSTSAWQIGVQVEEGAATLSGEVDSYAEMQLAGKVAKGVTGVTSLANELEVRVDAPRDDREIRNEIEQRLAWDVRIDDGLIDVAVADGRVELSGAVGSSYESTLAHNAAWVAGVHAVDSDGLRVEWWARDAMERASGWSEVDDEAVERAVRDAFLYDPRVLSFQPDVEVKNGVVTLRGTVDNLKAKQAAGRDARNTVGVWRVLNRLEVAPAEPRPDAELEDEIEAALRDDAIVRSTTVLVDAEDGRVALYGTADSVYEKLRAGDLAATVRGVKEVDNRLRVDWTVWRPDYGWDPVESSIVETVDRRSDREIREDVESQLWWSPFVDEDQVEVLVDGGVATLSGTVDSWYERRVATVNALEGGAWKVQNRLRVDPGMQN